MAGPRCAFCSPHPFRAFILRIYCIPSVSGLWEKQDHHGTKEPEEGTGIYITLKIIIPSFLFHIALLIEAACSLPRGASEQNKLCAWLCASHPELARGNHPCLEISRGAHCFPVCFSMRARGGNVKAVCWDLGWRRGEPPGQGCACPRPAGTQPGARAQTFALFVFESCCWWRRTCLNKNAHC